MFYPWKGLHKNWWSQNLNPSISDAFTSGALTIFLYSFCSDLVMWVCGLSRLEHQCIFRNRACGCETLEGNLGLFCRSGSRWYTDNALDMSRKEYVEQEEKRTPLTEPQKPQHWRSWEPQKWHSEMTRKVRGCRGWGGKRCISLALAVTKGIPCLL